VFEKFTSANAADFRQRYQGTFGFYRNDHEKKEPLLCQLKFIEDKVAFTDKRGIEYSLNPDVPENIGFQFLPPKAGYFNTSTGAMLVTRTAARQFQRGISDRNTAIYSLDQLRGFRSVGVTFATLEKVFYSKLSVEEAVAAFNSGKAPSVAFSSQFGTDGNNVYVLATVCGKVIDKSPELWKIKLDDPDLFKTEINDALKAFQKVEFVVK
jgi:hypothetical protein